MRRLLRVLLLVPLVLVLALPALPVAAADQPAQPILIMAPAGRAFSDMEGHWALAWVDQWASQGLVLGYPDGTFGPERTVTRAELAALINRALGLSATVAGPEVLLPGPTPDWHAETMAIAISAGYIRPATDGEGGNGPDDLLTRGDLATMLAAALRLPSADVVAALANFNDAADAPDQYRAGLAALIEAGYMNGFPDGALRPNEETTRAQAVTLLARALGQMYLTAGAYGPTAGDPEFIRGSASVAADGVVLRNLFIAGDLYVVPGAAGATVRLDNVAVLGTLRLTTGATVILDGARVASLALDAPAPAGADVVASGDAFIGETVVRSAAQLRETNLAENGFGFAGVVLATPPGAAIELSGVFDQVAVRAPGGAMRLLVGSIDQLVVEPAAIGAAIDLATSTAVERLLLQARADVAGPGAVATAYILAGNSVLQTAPTQVVVAPNIAATVAGQQRTGELVAVREFTFAVDDPAGWIGGFCDYPVDVSPLDWEMQAMPASLPPELGQGAGFMLQGHNHSDDMFMYVRRQFSAAEAVQAGTTYAVWIELDLATNAPAGAVGIGGAPGESVFVKVGASQTEPVPVADLDSYWRLIVDKGAQSEGGNAAAVIGNVAKSSTDWNYAYELKTLNNYLQPLIVTASTDGTLWIFAGTDSGFEGLTRLYYVRINVRLSVTE